MRTVPLAVGALAACLLFPTVVRAQEPVPVGERVTPAGVAGNAVGPKVVLRGSDGKILSSTSVVVRNLGTNQRTVIETTATGRALLPKLPPGRYEVTTRTPGRPAVTGTVTIPAGGTALALFSGGPVPVAEPVPNPSPVPEPSPVPDPVPVPVPVPDGEPSAPAVVALAVEEKKLENDVALQTWLATRTTERLEAVVPLSAGTSLFVFRSGPGMIPRAYSVFHAAEALSADGLETRLALHKGRALLGVHILGPSAHLLVFADER